MLLWTPPAARRRRRCCWAVCPPHDEAPAEPWQIGANVQRISSLGPISRTPYDTRRRGAVHLPQTCSTGRPLPPVELVPLLARGHVGGEPREQLADRLVAGSHLRPSRAADAAGTAPVVVPLPGLLPGHVPVRIEQAGDGRVAAPWAVPFCGCRAALDCRRRARTAGGRSCCRLCHAAARARRRAPDRQQKDSERQQKDSGKTAERTLPYRRGSALNSKLASQLESAPSPSTPAANTLRRRLSRSSVVPALRLSSSSMQPD